MVKVIKRDKSEVEFDSNKIYEAVYKAYTEVHNEPSDKFCKGIATIVESQIDSLGLVSVEHIQDLVEDALMTTDKEVARAYIRYRYKRQMTREAITNLDYEILSLKDGTSEEVINNANKDGKKIQTLKPMIADVTIIDQAKRLFIPDKILKHHEKEIYIHDMGYFGLPFFNCMLVNWQDCFDGGMSIGGATIEKPKSFATAIALLSQLAAHVSSNCYGGITFPQLTKGLCEYAKMSLEKYKKFNAGFVNEDKLEEFAWKQLAKEIKDGTQSLEFEIQTLTNSRGEVPFITIELDTIDLDASDEDQKIQHMIITALLNQRIAGLTGGVTPVFPKMVFELKRGNNLEPIDKYYDVFKLAVKCSSLRLYPDYLMHDKLVEVTGSYKPPMSCRSFLPRLVVDHKEYMYGFNLGVCSINLPRLAIMADHNEDKFYELLDEYLDLTKEALLLRRKLLVGVKAKQAPVLYQYGAVARLNPEDSIESLLYKDRSTISIGYVGVHNALVALYGESYNTNPEMVNKGVKMVQYLKDYAERAKNETNIGFSLYSTPAETLATKFCRSDVKEFGIIKGVNDKGYYENSFHYPSNEDIVAFDKINLECNMSKLATGGSIQYTEFGNMVNNPEALEKIIRYAYDKCHYFGVNVSADRCFKCGYAGEMDAIDKTSNDFVCPQCGNTDKSKMSVIRRLCGYLGSLSERPSVDGKMLEMASRVKHFKTGCGE